jgi:hypothetical protein
MLPRIEDRGNLGQGHEVSQESDIT